MGVSQPVVGLHGAHGIEVLPDEVGRFHALQHVAVHSVGSQHKVITQALCVEVANIVVQVAIGVLHHPAWGVGNYISFVT